MLNEFLTYIKTNGLFKPTDAILLAVSGGVDSVVMAHLFSKAKLKFGIAHCNFQLRGVEAEKDAAFVERLAKDLSVPFFTKSFETKKYAKENGLSTQLAARSLRYEWFEKVLLEYDYKYLATAHHLNDTLETVLYNLVKGTGISGLTGIPVVNDKIIRPLSFASREMVEVYAKDKNLRWREDATNNENDYSRNLIRNTVVPELRKINPSLEETFKTTLERLQSIGRVIDKNVEQLLSNSSRKKGIDIYLQKEALQNVEVAVLTELLKKYGFNFAQAVDIKETLGEIGKVFQTDKYILNIDRSEVIISKIENRKSEKHTIISDQRHYESPHFELQLETRSGNKPDLDMDACLDYDKLTFPLIVRKWEQGDSFKPLGMQGEKKLSDFMIDNKIPLNLKDRVHVMVSGKDIVWVIGHRIDDRYKITNKTKSTFNIRLQQK